MMKSNKSVFDQLGYGSSSNLPPAVPRSDRLLPRNPSTAMSFWKNLPVNDSSIIQFLINVQRTIKKLLTRNFVFPVHCIWKYMVMFLSWSVELYSESFAVPKLF